MLWSSCIFCPVHRTTLQRAASWLGFILHVCTVTAYSTCQLAVQLHARQNDRGSAVIEHVSL